MGPEQVLAVVRDTLESVREVSALYGLVVDETLPPERTEVSPEHVYAALLDRSRWIQALGLPTIVPNDVCRVAAALRRRVEALARLRGVTLPPRPRPSRDKTPSDAYAAAAARSPAMADFVAGGVLVPLTVPSPVKPFDVMQVPCVSGCDRPRRLGRARARHLISQQSITNYYPPLIRALRNYVLLLRDAVDRLSPARGNDSERTRQYA